MWTFELAIMLLMIGMNSVFAAYEISLASIGTGRLHSLVDVGKRGSEAAVRMKGNIEGSLAVVQLGITLVGVIAAATGGAGAEETFEPMLLGWGVPESVSQIVAIVLVVVPLTVVTIVFGELVPKVFALRNTEWVCLTLSPVMEWFAVSVKPAVWFLENAVSWIMRISGSSSDDAENQTVIKDLHGAAAFARISRLIGQREEGIIMSASRLSSTPVKKILMPAEYIDMLVADQSLADALLAAHLNMHTRYPVTEVPGNAQRIIGYVNFKDIVANMRLAPHLTSFRKLIRSMESFDLDSPISECLERLIRERSHIALVRDRAGVILGMITLEDIIEELVGEIHDELDRIPTHLIKTGDGWIAGGFVSLSRLREVAGVELPPIGDKPLYTLNDWVFESLGRPPKGGDSVQSDTCNIVVRKTRNVMVQEAFVSTSQTSDGSFINASNRFSKMVLLALMTACLVTSFTQTLRAKEPIPEKLVVLTFDDSAKSHFTVVRPLLLTYGFSATFFITEGFDFSENKRDYMTWEEIAQLHQDGFEIGNHTRDHLSINDKNFDKLPEQLEGINQRCVENGIAKPVSFAWPGNSLAPAGLEALASAGIRFARRGGTPEFEYDQGRGFAYEPMLDHPLLIPSAGDARPDWELDDFVRAVEQAKYGRIAVLQFHGVPDTAHNWVNTPKAKFEQYMRYLAVEGYQVVALRDLEKFVDASVKPKDPMGVIEDRKNIIAKHGEYDNFRMPKNDGELEFWLQNMLFDHHYSLSEISAVTGMSATEVQMAVERLKIDNPVRLPEDQLRVLPYPGGRHPRTGFRDGAIRPQRETKLSIFLPWDRQSYVVADVPEAIWWMQEDRRELLYLAHTHVKTTWDSRGLKLASAEWQRTDSGWQVVKQLPNGVEFGCQAQPHDRDLRLKLWIKNGSPEPLKGLVVQNCMMLARAQGFDQLTNENKLIADPLVACHNAAKTRWIVTGWQNCVRPWANQPCPCMHSDPQFPDCPSGETRELNGVLSFYSGTDIQSEFVRLEPLLRSDFNPND